MKIKSLYVLTLLLFSNLLLAHSNIKSSSPSDGEILDKSPEVISLAFLNPVKLIKFKLVSSDQNPVNTDFKPSMVDRSDFRIIPEELPNGQYTVFWTIMGVDGHKMKNEFKFKVKKMAETEHHDEHEH